MSSSRKLCCTQNYATSKCSFTVWIHCGSFASGEGGKHAVGLQIKQVWENFVHRKADLLVWMRINENKSLSSSSWDQIVFFSFILDVVLGGKKNKQGSLAFLFLICWLHFLSNCLLNFTAQMWGNFYIWTKYKTCQMLLRTKTKRWDVFVLNITIWRQ